MPTFRPFPLQPPGRAREDKWKSRPPGRRATLGRLCHPVPLPLERLIKALEGWTQSQHTSNHRVGKHLQGSAKEVTGTISLILRKDPGKRVPLGPPQAVEGGWGQHSWSGERPHC